MKLAGTEHLLSPVSSCLSYNAGISRVTQNQEALSSVPAVPSVILTLCKLAKEKCSVIKSRKIKGGFESERQ